jgi:hypothetical protein
MLTSPSAEAVMSTIEFVVLTFFVGTLALIVAEVVWNDPRALREILVDSEGFARRAVPAPVVARSPAKRRLAAQAGLAAAVSLVFIAVL